MSGSNRTSAISEKRSSVFDTASLPSGNGNNQPVTAPAMLLVQSQQVSKPLSLTMPYLEHRGLRSPKMYHYEMKMSYINIIQRNYPISTPPTKTSYDSLIQIKHFTECINLFNSPPLKI